MPRTSDASESPSSAVFGPSGGVRLHRVQLPVQTGLTSLRALTRGLSWAPLGVVAVVLGILTLLGVLHHAGMNSHLALIGLPLIGAGVWLVRHGGEQLFVASWRKPSDIVLDAEGLTFTFGAEREPELLPWSALQPQGCTLERFSEERASKDLVPEQGQVPHQVSVQRLHVHTRDRGWLLIGQAESEPEEQALMAVHVALSVGSAAPAADEGTASHPDALPLLSCPSCGAPQSLDDAHAVTCRRCGAKVPVPLPHATQLASVQQGARHAEQIEETLHALTQQQPDPLTLWRSSVRLLAPLALLWPATLYLTLDAFLQQRWLHVLGWGALAPLATLALYSWLSVPVARRQALRVLTLCFGAQPPLAPGEPARCRGCGAPLAQRDSPAAALIRCAYCRADNLLQLDLGPPIDALRWQAGSLQSVLLEQRSELAMLRRRAGACAAAFVLALGALCAL